MGWRTAVASIHSLNSVFAAASSGSNARTRASTEAESPVAKKQRNGTDERDAGGG